MLVPYTIVVTLLIVFRRTEMSFVRYLFEVTGIKTSYWYVAYQMKWYLVFFLTMAFVPQRALAVFALVGILMFLSLGELEIEQSPAFLIGVAASRFRVRLMDFSCKQILWQLAGFLAVGLGFLAIKQLPAVREHFGSWPYSLIQMVQNTGIALAIIAGVSLAPWVRRNRFLVFCGVIAYEIYLLHFPFYPGVGGDITLAMGLICAAIAAAMAFHALNNYLMSKLSK